MGKKEGGLGVTSTITAAMERKRKNLLEMIHREGSTGLAMKNQVSRMMREAGQGGLGPCRRGGEITHLLSNGCTTLTGNLGAPNSLHECFYILFLYLQKQNTKATPYSIHFISIQT
jgi:hypothetical protein